MSVAEQRTVLVANPAADLYGSDRMVLETVSVLAEAGWRTVVTVPRGGPLCDEITALGAELRVCPTPVVRKSALRPRGLVSFLADLLRGLRTNSRLIKELDPDLVLVNTVTIPLWLVLARLTGRRAVCHVHEAEAAASKLTLLILNAPVLMADAAIVNSEFSRRVLVRAIPRLADRSTVVYNTVRPPTAVSSPRESLQGGARLLFVGRLSARKGPDVAIDAVRLLHQRGIDVALSIVGSVVPGQEAFEEQLRATVKEAGLNDRVTFHGFDPDIGPYVRDCDIMLVPSTLDEPFGNTAVEAVLSARPVVVSNVGGLPEAVAGFSSAVLVTPRNSAEIADAVARVIEQWDEYGTEAVQDAGNAARRYSRQSYASGITHVIDQAFEGSQHSDAK